MQSYWSKVLNNRIHRRRALAMTGSTALDAALLAACGGGGNGGGQPDASSLITQPEDTSKQAKRGGILKNHTPTDAPSFDYATPISDGSLASRCYATLIRVVPGYLKPNTNELGPYMAESWESSPDGLQITLKLRQGVKFHNKDRKSVV